MIHGASVPRPHMGKACADVEYSSDSAVLSEGHPMRAAIIVLADDETHEGLGRV